MKNNQKKLWYFPVLYGTAFIISVLLVYGVYSGIYEYIYYRDYKTVENIKLLYVYPRESDSFRIDLPVKFVPEIHNAVVRQKLLVRGENKKSFMIYRYQDNKIQLMSFPIRSYFYSNRRFHAYYEICDAAAIEKLERLLDAHLK